MFSQLVEYKFSNLTMEGFIAREPSNKPQAIVLIVHDWSGCREVAQERAKYFARQGYVGFAVDLYGKGKRGSDTDGGINQKLMSEVMHNRASIVERLQAALDCALALENVDANKVMFLGFCFGGLCALDFARSGAKVSGVVSIHGLFSKPDIHNNSKIIAKVLAIHGYLDKMATPQSLIDFQREMTERGADWQTHVLSTAYHAFTNPKAHDPNAGLEYNKLADERTWRIVKAFTDELFA